MQFHLLSIGCHVYSYSTVNRRTFDLLHKLQLLPAMDCSGTPHVVDHCSPRWSAVIPLYFHCTLTANISSVVVLFCPSDHSFKLFFCHFSLILWFWSCLATIWRRPKHHWLVLSLPNFKSRGPIGIGGRSHRLLPRHASSWCRKGKRNMMPRIHYV